MQPLKYFEKNLEGMMALVLAMEATTCCTLVFSSSATDYGDPASVPITNDFPRSHKNPNGHTKLVCEEMLAACELLTRLGELVFCVISTLWARTPVV